MAILYVFTANDPNNVGHYPPSFVSNAQATKLADYITQNGTTGPSSTQLVFADESALNAFLAEYTITDAGLLADIASWKSAHGITYSSNYYSLPDAGITTPGVIV